LEQWEPELIRHTTVDPQEFEGYEIWCEAEDEGAGGVWGGPEKPKGVAAKLKRLFRRN
jgi:hypothetical protein